jgi:hypothetical protein
VKALGCGGDTTQPIAADGGQPAYVPELVWRRRSTRSGWRLIVHHHEPMLEVLWVLGMLLAVGGYAAFCSVPAEQLVIAGQYVMLGSAALGVPLEVVYFGLLAWALHANGDSPQGWYLRSFKHHVRLQAWQRLWILPLFYVGALAFLGIVFGIAISLLGFVAALG